MIFQYNALDYTIETTDGGELVFTIGRQTKMAGHTMGNAMGVNTWAAFAGSDDKAVVLRFATCVPSSPPKVVELRPLA